MTGVHATIYIVNMRCDQIQSRVKRKVCNIYEEWSKSSWKPLITLISFDGFIFRKRCFQTLINANIKKISAEVFPIASMMLKILVKETRDITPSRQRKQRR